MSLAVLQFSILAGTSPLVFAETVLEEVVVSAQRRQENLQEVPLAVTAFSQDVLGKSGVNGARDLPVLAPSVQLVTSGPSNMFFVRGVGNTSAGSGEEGTNAFYVDGVFVPSLKQTAMKFNNVERVEVLKGPQGTLFGRNSSGGLVNVITSEPGSEFALKANLGIANYDTTSAQLYVAGPLTEQLSADLAITSTDQGKGWGENRTTGNDVSLGWDWGLRSKWVWRASDNAKLTFSADYAKSSDNYALAYSLAPESQGINFGAGVPQPLDDPYDTTNDVDPYIDQTIYGFNLTAEFDLGWATLTSITGHRSGENDSFFDADMQPVPITSIRVEDTEKSYQEELRLASNSDSRLHWQTGIFLLRIEAELDPQTFSIGIPSAFDYKAYSSLDTTSYAAFADITYALTATTEVTVGGRYTHDKLEFEGEQLSVVPAFQIAPRKDSLSESEPTYRIALRQQLGDNLSLYASYNRGFKSGTFSMSAPDQNPVDPQTIDAYELGLKSEWLDRRLRLNLAAFHYEIDDYQVRSASGVTATPILLNAAEVDIDGVEVEFEALPLERLRVFGSLSWLDSEFVEFPYAPLTALNPSPVGGLVSPVPIGDASGNKTPLAPDLAATLGFAYSAELGALGEMDFSVLYHYNDGYYFEPDNRTEQPAYGVLNAMIAYRPSAHWAVELWGRNLEDETYYNQKLAVSRFGDVGVPAAPRSYGVNVKFVY